MSGPKYNFYKLSKAERKRLLEEALKRQKEMAFKKESQRVNKLIQAEENNISEASRQIARQKDLTINNIQVILKNIEQELTKIKANSDTIMVIQDQTILEVYQTHLEKYQDLSVKNSSNNNEMTLKKLFDNYLEVYHFLDEVTEYKKQSQEIIEQVKSKTRSNLSAAIEDNLARYGYLDYLKKQNINLDEYVIPLNELSSNQKLTVELKENVLKVIEQLKKITNPTNLKEYCLGVVSQIISECQNYLEEYDKQVLEFQKLFERYQSLCLVLHQNALNYEFSKENLSQLKEKVKEYEIAAEKELERQFIATAFNEILQEMGYNLLGQKTKSLSSSAFYCNRIYSYDNGNVASVLFSSDGQISIEIGKLSNNNILTSKDVSSQVKSMEHLCEDLPIIEEKLKQRGISLDKRVLMQPVDPCFAQTIKASDYNIHIIKDNNQYESIKEEVLQYMEDEEWL